MKLSLFCRSSVCCKILCFWMLSISAQAHDTCDPSSGINPQRRSGTGHAIAVVSQKNRLQAYCEKVLASGSTQEREVLSQYLGNRTCEAAARVHVNTPVDTTEFPSQNNNTQRRQ